MKPALEVLESRDLPSVTLLNGTLFILEQGPGIHTVSVDSVAGQIQVTEGDGSGFNNAVSLFDSSLVTGVIVAGSANGVNVIQQNTSLSCILQGGNRGDTIIGGSGSNLINGGGGHDVLYSLLGKNIISSYGGGEDYILTNYPALVFADSQDTVVRFFGPGRAPGQPFIGFDPSLGDGVLYITPSNNGSWVVIDPGPTKDSVVASYDLGDGNGPQTQLFTGVQFISYFGGSGNDAYLNNTRIGEAAYGGAGNDFVVGGTGDVSFLKGLGGGDVVVGRGDHNDISGNAGADFLVDLGHHRDDVIRTDAADLVFALAPYISISP